MRRNTFYYNFRARKIICERLLLSHLHYYSTVYADKSRGLIIMKNCEYGSMQGGLNGDLRLSKHQRGGFGGCEVYLG